MLIIPPPGWVLASGGYFVRGGPQNLLLGPGMRLLSSGQVIDEESRFVKPPGYPPFLPTAEPAPEARP